MEIQGKELAVACAKAADETKAEEIRIWDMRVLSNLTDFMVVCSGTSMPQLRAILRDVAGQRATAVTATNTAFDEVPTQRHSQCHVHYSVFISQF